LKPAVALSLHDRREQMASEGDVRGLFDLITQTPWSLHDLHAAYGQLLRALDIASQKDPAGSSDLVFQIMVSFTAYLVMRGQLSCIRSMEQNDREIAARPQALVPPLDQQLLDQLVTMQEHLAKLQFARATTARMWKLSRSKELELERIEEERNQPGRASTQTTSPNGRNRPVRTLKSSRSNVRTGNRKHG
jgi:hypothetical protein